MPESIPACQPTSSTLFMKGGSYGRRSFKNHLPLLSSRAPGDSPARARRQALSAALVHKLRKKSRARLAMDRGAGERTRLVAAKRLTVPSALMRPCSRPVLTSRRRYASCRSRTQGATRLLPSHASGLRRCISAYRVGGHARLMRAPRWRVRWDRGPGAAHDEKRRWRPQWRARARPEHAPSSTSSKPLGKCSRACARERIDRLLHARRVGSESSSKPLVAGYNSSLQLTTGNSNPYLQ